MLRSLVVVALLVSVASDHSTALARSTSGRKRCPTTRVITANRQAEIYEAEEPGVGTGFIRACAYSTGRVSRLGHVTECGSGICVGTEREILNGAIAAYEPYFSGLEGNPERNVVVVRDLRTGRILHRLPTGTPLVKRPESIGVGSTTGLVVTASGDVAWIAWDVQRSQEETRTSSGRRFYDVYASDKSGTRLLASGFDVSPSSLALAGSTIYWSQGGKPSASTLGQLS